MAVFGAPMERENDAERAILAAKEMKRQLAVMMAKQEGHRKKFDIRIGINTGRVVTGNIGSPKRMDYSYRRPGQYCLTIRINCQAESNSYWRGNIQGYEG